MEFAFAADLPGWEPDGGETVEMEGLGQALSIELVGLVHMAHHDLGFGSVGQEGNAAGSFDLIGDPVPVANALQGNGTAFREVLEEGLDGAQLMFDPLLGEKAAVLI